MSCYRDVDWTRGEAHGLYRVHGVRVVAKRDAFRLTRVAREVVGFG